MYLLRKDPWNGDDESVVTYYGYAKPGTLDYNSTWTIKRKSVINGIKKIEYPFIDNINNVQLSGLRWDYRTTYTYSEISEGGLIQSGIWDDNKIWLDTDIWVDYP